VQRRRREARLERVAVDERQRQDDGHCRLGVVRIEAMVLGRPCHRAYRCTGECSRAVSFEQGQRASRPRARVTHRWSASRSDGRASPRGPVRQRAGTSARPSRHRAARRRCPCGTSNRCGTAPWRAPAWPPCSTARRPSACLASLRHRISADVRERFVQRHDPVTPLLPRKPYVNE